MTKTFEIADLVKWFEYYEDRIVRDAGLGVVVRARPCTLMDREWMTYLVYKFKTSNMDWFDEDEVDQVIPPVPER